ncbi:MAG TPA: hypothetical protein DEB09_04040 [Candidatus Magasanikbacteria bacterium]|nr:hypothetical protein [Candidatus Magasanikbacteria bacterium]
MPFSNIHAEDDDDELKQIREQQKQEYEREREEEKNKYEDEERDEDEEYENKNEYEDEEYIEPEEEIIEEEIIPEEEVIVPEEPLIEVPAPVQIVTKTIQEVVQKPITIMTKKYETYYVTEYTKKNPYIVHDINNNGIVDEFEILVK